MSEKNNIEMILKNILGDKCEDVINIFKDQEIDREDFVSIDKEVLIELGMKAFFIHLLSLFILRPDVALHWGSWGYTRATLLSVKKSRRKFCSVKSLVGE